MRNAQSHARMPARTTSGVSRTSSIDRRRVTRYLSILLAVPTALVLLGCPLPTSAPLSLPTVEDAVVDIAEVIGVTAPARGATPVATITETAQYTGVVSWSDSPETFAANTTYTATITLSAKAGFTFRGVAEDFFVVAGATSDTNPADLGVVTAVFPATGPVPDAVINLAAIPGVMAPLFEATPVATIPETEQYTGTVSWSDSPEVFAASTTYTATITLTAKPGFTFAGVLENFFSVTGATSATNEAGSGVVEVVFPDSGDGRYTSATIGVLRYVPAGRFQRDFTSSNISVITRPFRMSEHEITRTQYEAIMDDDPSVEFNSTGTNNPVQSMTWYEAITFANRLSLAEGLTPVYAVSGVDFTTLTLRDIPSASDDDWNAVTADWDANGYRLPTEMEWMWAAMGAPGDGRDGGTNATGHQKAFAGSDGSNALGDYAWYSGNAGDSKSRPVGGKLSNELGLYDMSGNVWDWVWDWHAAYPAGTLTDYRGATSASGRVLRGGTASGNASVQRVAYRAFLAPATENPIAGFRVVRR